MFGVIIKLSEFYGANYAQKKLIQYGVNAKFAENASATFTAEKGLIQDTIEVNIQPDKGELTKTEQVLVPTLIETLAVGTITTVCTGGVGLVLAGGVIIIMGNDDAKDKVLSIYASLKESAFSILANVMNNSNAMSEAYDDEYGEKVNIGAVMAAITLDSNSNVIVSQTSPEIFQGGSLGSGLTF